MSLRRLAHSPGIDGCTSRLALTFLLIFLLLIVVPASTTSAFTLTPFGGLQVGMLGPAPVLSEPWLTAVGAWFARDSEHLNRLLTLFCATSF